MKPGLVSNFKFNSGTNQEWITLSEIEINKIKLLIGKINRLFLSESRIKRLKFLFKSIFFKLIIFESKEKFIKLEK